MDAPPDPEQTLIAEFLSLLRTVRSVHVYPGDAHETYPPTDPDEPLVVIEEQGQLRPLIETLATADVSSRAVVPALAALRLCMRDAEGDEVLSVDVLSWRWVRSWLWPHDAPLAAPVLTSLADRLGPYLAGRETVRAVDPVKPCVPAARVGFGSGGEHAVMDVGGPTLCGIPAGDIRAFRHPFAFAAGDCAECTRLIWERYPSERAARERTASAESRALTAAWERTWADAPPLAHWLRSSPRWVRLHSFALPQRYADDESDYAALVHKHRVVLDELVAAMAHPTEEVVVVTTSWSLGPTPLPERAPVAALLPGAEHWRSLLEPGHEEDSPVWTHLFTRRLRLDDPRLDTFLRMVADEVTANVLIADPEVRWLFCPYDGGVDVYPETVTQRDKLRREHAGWLSSHPLGL